jgi:hypothetical protein
MARLVVVANTHIADRARDLPRDRKVALRHEDVQVAKKVGGSMQLFSDTATAPTVKSMNGGSSLIPVRRPTADGRNIGSSASSRWTTCSVLRFWTFPDQLRHVYCGRGRA